MIKDKNDMANIAHEAGELLKWKDAHLNLIPYNENLSIDLEESSPKTIRKFKSIVENYWVTVTIRQNMGRKEKSACWQLGFEAVQAQL
jgi:23S rRNA (adenine2503-C2)-methyltransferase